MEIESVQVIPMLKDSKWEDTNRIFEVSMITTDYATWFTSIYEEILSFVEIARPETDENCVNFCKTTASIHACTNCYVWFIRLCCKNNYS